MLVAARGCIGLARKRSFPSHLEEPEESSSSGTARESSRPSDFAHPGRVSATRRRNTAKTSSFRKCYQGIWGSQGQLPQEFGLRYFDEDPLWRAPGSSASGPPRASASPLSSVGTLPTSDPYATRIIRAAAIRSTRMPGSLQGSNLVGSVNSFVPPVLRRPRSFLDMM